MKKTAKVNVKLNFEEVCMIREKLENHFYSKECENSERKLLISLMVKCDNAFYKICK